ncbi:hypothetical protein [Trueperella pecoris]|uniref:TadE-like protein n=1 Tax=Trueperella pecoris TaxID=2733571 RepID=A0A7M1QY69_9ACTO|nr:hypothetical protein [Trueperella pecoris]QOQ38516.1 hypothetical protein HLG82_02970 [Trueperella pecoris]QOR44995.1 hypothetical protein INS88_06815 [Trueperella pecoris]QOR47032.1 hypothetical protein INS90_07070 [Trueperella pecoris]QTG74895.1 hypothetical protein J4179_06605 [Trueperella pecoris]
MPLAASSASDRNFVEPGNATVGFVASVGLLLAVVYTIIAAGMNWYVHAIITDSAMEGARVGVASGSTHVAKERTRDLITTTLSTAYAEDIAAQFVGASLEITVHAPTPGAGFLGSHVIEVKAHAQRE